ncbi:hypothetical protein [Amycolatopsis acidicola]|uniref:hypothetical protein n=1 Tax=Amycolatopsis acidicola TaxID=2596893 RepID=UPI001AA070FD|nr:hypothetical protein [Amycolatopsis acidicola]
MELGREWAAVTGEVAPGTGSPERNAFEGSGAQAFLAVPFVGLPGSPGHRRLVVGQARVLVTAGAAEVRVAVDGIWSEKDGWRAETEPEKEFSLPAPNLAAAPDGEDPEDVAAQGSLLPSMESRDGAGPEGVAVSVAKAIAENSRNQVLVLRSLRYELERRLAGLLAGRRGGVLRPLLAEIIELSTALGRARDQAQRAVRDGLWMWLWDAESYHRNRPDSDPVPGQAPPWFRTYRNAVLHCEAVDTQLAEEISRLHSLLSSMSAFAVAQDAEAQERFNLLAAVVAAGLGLPALILSLYGADSFLPLNSFDHAWRALLPIGATVGVATIAAVRFLPGRARPRHYLAAVAVVLGLLAMLLFAGVFAPPGK